MVKLKSKGFIGTSVNWRPPGPENMKSATGARNFHRTTGKCAAELQREWTPGIVRLKAIVYVEKKERIVLRKDEADAIL